MASPWTNPLQALALVADNPARAASEDLSEALSSVLLEPEEFESSRQDAIKLVEGYQPGFLADDTAALLQLFLDKLPKEGQTALISDILVCKQDLRPLRDHLVDAILKPMKLAGGKQPVSEPSNNPAAIELITLSLHEIEPSRRDQGRLKRSCLIRDGFRCVISGHYDRASVRAGKVDVSTNDGLVRTQCAHILPFALSDFDDRVATETRNKATIWFALHRYFPELRGKIDTSKVNQYGNLMTMEEGLHGAFGQYEIGLWPTERDNTYQIRTLDGLALPALIRGQEYVHFVSHDPQIPLPDKDFLKTHCRIGEILRVSGIGQRIEDEMDNSLDDPLNMRPDGTTDLWSILERKMLIRI